MIESRSPALQADSLQLSHKRSPRTLEFVVHPFSSRSSWPKNQTGVSCIAGGFFTNWAIRKALRQCIKKQRHHYTDKGLSSESNGFSSSHVWMWELNHKESWMLKNWCFQTVVLEKTLESLLDCKEIKPVNSKGNQPWIFIGRTDAEAPVFWSPDGKSWLIGKDQCWERLKTGGERDDRGWDGWMASLTQWTWVWASSRRWWGTGRPGVLQSMGPPRVRHDWVTEQLTPGNH